MLTKELQELWSSETGQNLKNQLMTSAFNPQHFMVTNGMLPYKNRLYIPLETELQGQILSKFHDTKIGGHLGVRHASSSCSKFLLATDS